MMTTLGRIAAVAVMVGFASAQDKPSFAGKWTGIPGETVPTGLPNSRSICIAQDRDQFTVGCDAKTRLSYRLDGTATRREETVEGVLRTITARAAWAGSKLVITEEDNLRKRETTYAFDTAGSSKLVVIESTNILHTRGGALTVSPIGPSTRAYKKGS